MRRACAQSGSALLAAMLAMMILGIGVAAVWKSLHQRNELQRSIERREICRQLAEAGIDKAIAMLRRDPAWRGERGTPLGAGYFDVAVTPAAPAGGFQVAASGRLAEGRTVRAQCDLKAVFALDAHGVRRFRCWTPEK